MVLSFCLSNMNKDFESSVKLIASDTGSAVLVKQEGGFYLLTAAHICEDQTEQTPVTIIDSDGKEQKVSNLKRVLSPSKKGDDVCVMKLPEDLPLTITGSVKCATFEGSGYSCEIDGYPSNASDNKLRIEEGCKVAKETEVGDGLYVELGNTRNDGMKLDDIECGFSGSGVFVDSNGDKYLIGIVYRVEDTRNLFIGWKMQRINEILKGEGWKEIPLVAIELRQQIIDQYNHLIRNSNFVLSRIKNTIIGHDDARQLNHVQLPRIAFKEKVENAIADSRIVIITGEAGIGKSAIAKEVLTNPKFKSVAVVGDDLDEKREELILSHWQISDRLQDIYESPIWGEGDKVLLVESAERMLNGNTDTAIVFVDNLLKETPSLKVVFTIRKNSLNLFRVALHGNGIDVPEKSVIEIGLLDDDEIKMIEDSISSVKPFLESDKTRDVLRNPFYMNLACSIVATKNIDSFSGSEFKDMLCREIVTGKKHDPYLATQRINTLIDVARKTSNAGMNLVKCEMTDAAISLMKDDVLTGIRDSAMLRPGHDILTDWGLYCYVDDCFRRLESNEINLAVFYEHIDKNIASRNIFKQFVETHINEEYPKFDTFVLESLSLKLEDFFCDDLFYAILVSEKGAPFLASIKPVLLRNNSSLLKRMSNALSYMFRKVDWDIKDFLMKNGMIEEGGKIRNSDYMLPTGKGWYTFVTFLYENRDAFKALREDLIPLLLQCELVSMPQEDAPNLKKYVFSILADDLELALSDENSLIAPSKAVVRLLFKWMDENPELVKTWAEKAISSKSYKYKTVKEFLLLSERLDAFRLIHTYPELYKSLIRKEWFGKDGFVRDYYSMIHQSSALSTTYICFFYSNPVKALVFLCELLNEDIEKMKTNRQCQLQEIKVKLEDKEVTVWGNDSLWREYRGGNYQSHVRESLLMTMEKCLMDYINNNIKKAQYPYSKDTILAFYDIVYNKCINVCAWGVLASVATRFPLFVGMKAMPIYSCREFILWDKTRYSSESMKPMISPHASKNVRKEVADSYNLPHRKKDLEGVILTMSITEGYSEEFRELVKNYKDSATTYLEKVSASRMDISQYEIIGKTDEGFLIQGSPSDDIKEEAEQNEVFHNQFNRIIETSNLSRKRYDDDIYDLDEWREAYSFHKEQNTLIESKGLVASLGVKKYWKELNRKEREWCKSVIIDDTMKFVTTGQYQVDSEYSSDGLLYLLDLDHKNKKVYLATLYLIDSIGENDALFTRFETTFKDLIFGKHKELAEKIILQYFLNTENRMDDVDKFAHVCKLLPTTVEDGNIDEMVSVYCGQFFDRWAVEDRYAHLWDMRIETFCAEYMVAMPFKRQKFIEETWLASCLKSVARPYGVHENPISSVFNHFCYVATLNNKENFWQLWEIMFEWYKTNKTNAVLSSLMLNFDMLRPDLLNNWPVMAGSGEHINKLLSILPSEGSQYLARLICRIGFKDLMPECLRYIDKDLLRRSASDKRFMRSWQDAIEDLYDDARTRDTIKRDEELRVAYVVILNGLISNGSAIAYMIRDYYI